MKKGDIYFANLDPTIGSEIKKTRPVVIVSNDANNRHSTRITVVPLTSQLDKVYPFEVLLQKSESGLNKASKAQCDQIRTISKKRLTSDKPSGKVNSKVLEKIYQAIKLHLDII
jgi:mRNA interferase MazF